MKRTPVVKILGLILIGIGLIFLLVSIAFGVRLSDFADRPDAAAKIVSIEEDYIDEDIFHIVTVSYTVDGRSYTAILNYYDFTFSVGKTITIKYDPDNAEDITYIFGDYLLFGVVLGVGIALLLSGGICIAVYLTSQLKNKKLLKEGRCLRAKIISAEYNESIEINGQCPVRLICRDADGRRYKSPNLRYALELFNAGDDILVYVNRYTPKKYYIDVEEYLKRTNANETVAIENI